MAILPASTSLSLFLESGHAGRGYDCELTTYGNGEQHLDVRQPEQTTPCDSKEGLKFFRQACERFCVESKINRLYQSEWAIYGPVQSLGVRYYAVDDMGGELEFVADNQDYAFDHIAEYWQDGDWTAGQKMVSVKVYTIDHNNNRTYIDSTDILCGDPAPTPDCEPDFQHKWERPWECVGGLKDNAGAWHKGGTTIVIKECCKFCGQYKIETKLGVCRNQGELDTIEYKDADEASQKWCSTAP